MARLRKASFNNTVEFVTTSIESGVLLPCNEVVKFVIKAAITRAQRLYPLKICHLLVEGTHVHMMVVIDNPEYLPGFMERFKTELAHYLNNLIGRNRVTVWCDGYDSPTVLTVSKVIDKIAYIYTNPAKDRVCQSIEKYPGLNTWSLFKHNLTHMHAEMISRDSVFTLANGKLSEKDFQRSARLLKKLSIKRRAIKFVPNAWMKCFGIEEQSEIDSINELIFKRIEELELKFNEKYLEEGKKYIPVSRLIAENFDLDYQPKRASGRKLWCLSDDIDLRKRYIRFVKGLAEEAKTVYINWRLGDFSKKFPAGMFPPRMRITCNLININREYSKIWV